MSLGNVSTLVDVARNQNPDGTAARIAEIVQDTNPIIGDIFYKQGNLDTGHQYTRHSATKKGSWVGYNEGAEVEKGDRTQETTQTAKLEAYTESDVDLMSLGAGEAHNRAVESKSLMQGMALEFGEKVFYGSRKNDAKQFDGLNTLVNDLSLRTVFGAGGVGSDNSSIYAVDWGDGKTYGITPKGSTAGLTHKNLGSRVKEFSDGSLLEVYNDRFTWKTGICIENTNSIGRIANIDVSDLAGAGETGYTGPDLLKLMVQLDNSFRAGYEGRVYYCQQDVLNALEFMAIYKANVYLKYMDFAGEKLLSFRGKPIRMCDAISAAEAVVA